MRIDHAKEALARIGAVGGANDGSWATAIAFEAQMHAALALAEQQRVTNLLLLDPTGDSLPSEVIDEMRDILGIPPIVKPTPEAMVAELRGLILDSVLKVYDEAVMGLLTDDAPPMTDDELATVLNAARSSIVAAITKAAKAAVA